SELFFFFRRTTFYSVIILILNSQPAGSPVRFQNCLRHTDARQNPVLVLKFICLACNLFDKLVFLAALHPKRLLFLGKPSDCCKKSEENKRPSRQQLSCHLFSLILPFLFVHVLVDPL